MGWQEFPMITCPHCNKESQIDDYYDFQSGDSFECCGCEKEIYIEDIDWILSANIKATKVGYGNKKPPTLRRGL